MFSILITFAFILFMILISCELIYEMILKPMYNSMTK